MSHTSTLKWKGLDKRMIQDPTITWDMFILDSYLGVLIKTSQSDPISILNYYQKNPISILNYYQKNLTSPTQLFFYYHKIDSDALSDDQYFIRIFSVLYS